MDEGLERAPTATGTMVVSLRNHQRLIVRQRRELAELFGFETRNKYEIASESGGALAFAAEQQKGIAGFLFRQFLGHWRTFQIKFFSPDRQVFLTAHHPFRWFFQRLEVFDGGGRLLGAIQRRFSILTKRFDVEDASGQRHHAGRVAVLAHLDISVCRGRARGRARHEEVGGRAQRGVHRQGQLRGRVAGRARSATRSGRWCWRPPSTSTCSTSSARLAIRP